MKKLWVLGLVAVLLLGACAAPESTAAGPSSSAVPRVSSAPSGERPLLEGHVSGTQMELEALVYFDVPGPFITDYYDPRSVGFKANFLLADNGVGVNLNGCRLQAATLSKGGTFVQFTVLAGEEKSVWRLTAEGELLCVAPGCERIFLDDGTAAVAYVKGGRLYYLPPSLDAPLDVGPVQMQPEALYWVDRPNAVFSSNGEWMLYENGLALCSVGADGSVRTHGSLGENYLLGGISDDGNLLVYAQEQYDSTKDAAQQNHALEQYIVNLPKPGLSTRVSVGDHAIFSRDGNELFVGGGTRFYLYGLASGLQKTHAPFGSQEEYDGYVFEFYVNGQRVMNHSGGWPPPGLMCAYAAAERFTGYFFTEWDAETIYHTCYQPLSAARPVWSAQDRSIVSVSPDGGRVLLVDAQGQHWMAEVDAAGEVRQSRADSGEPPWRLPPSGSTFERDFETGRLWLIRDGNRVLLWDE